MVCPQAYAQFAGAPLKLRKTSNPWRSPCGEETPPTPCDTWSTRVSSHSPPVFCASPGSLPALRTNQNGTLSRPSDIIIHLRKQVTASVPACIGAETLPWCWSCDQLRRIDRLIGVAHQSLVE